MALSSFISVIDLGLKSLLYSRFGSILELDSINRGVIQWPKEVALRMIADKKGKMRLDFINIHRHGQGFDWKRQRSAVAKRGFYIGTTDADRPDRIHIKGAPVKLEYNFWAWSRSLDRLNLVINSYLLWQLDNPNLSISFDGAYPIEPDLHFGDIADESSTIDMFNIGKYHVYRFPLVVDGWVFDDTFSFKTITEIILKIYDKDDITDFTSIVLDDSNQDTDLAAALLFSETHFFGILDIDLSVNSFIINGDQSSDFDIGDIIFINDSTGNDGRYTVSSIVVSTSQVGSGGIITAVVVTETIPDDTADGNITIRQ